MKAPVIERPDRRFQIWAYSVSMKRLLLRSTKSDTFATRLDVLFQNVRTLKLPTSLDGLVVTEAAPAEEARITAESGLLPSAGSTIFYVVHAGAFDGYVVAGICVVVEDDGEYFDPSQLWRDPTGPSADRAADFGADLTRLVNDALAVAASSFDARDLVPALTDLLELITSSPAHRGLATWILLDLLHAPGGGLPLSTPGAVEILEFTMHRLKWSDVRTAVIGLAGSASDWRVRRAAERVLEAFEEPWPGGEIYALT